MKLLEIELKISQYITVTLTTLSVVNRQCVMPKRILND